MSLAHPRPWQADTKHHLVHDEEEDFPGKPNRRGSFYLQRFRIRVWMAKDATPVALVSQVTGGIPPHWMVETIANYINEALLRYHAGEFLYFESERHEEVTTPVIHQCYFSKFGAEHRCRLVNPATEMRSWAFLERLVGEPIER